MCDLSGRKYQRKLGSVSEPLRGALFQNEAHVKVECSLDFVQFIEVVYVSVDGYIVMITKQKAFNKSLIDQKTQVVYMDPDDWEVLMQGGHFRSRLDIKKLLPTGNLMSHVHHLPNGNGFWGRAQCKVYFKSLNSRSVPGVQQSLHDSAMNCIVWASRVVCTPDDELLPPMPGSAAKPNEFDEEEKNRIKMMNLEKTVKVTKKLVLKKANMW